MPNLSLQPDIQRSLDDARLVDIDVAAEILHVPRSWLYDRTRRHAVPHIRLGKYVRFNLQELLAWARLESEER